MSIPIFLIPFAVFFACVVLELWLVQQLTRALVTRHPTVWQEMTLRGSFLQYAVFRFVMQRKDSDLVDPEVSRLAARVRRLFAFSFVVWLIYVACLIMFAVAG